MSLIDTGLEKGLIKFVEEKNFITYIHRNKKRSYNNPEEKVQAETFLSLVLNYGYPVNRIQQFVSVQMGSETKEADIIVYGDDECEDTYILVECKKEEITDQQFKIAVEQAYSYCVAEGGKYVWTNSKIINEYYEVPKERPRSRISIPDIPQFGVNKLAPYKYVKGGFLQSEGDEEVINLVSEPDPITHKSRVLDTSCGSGGFLLHALDKGREQAGHFYNFKQEPVQHKEHWHNFAEKNLFGIEINNQIARTAKMNMIIHDDVHTNVIASDGLLSDVDMQAKSGNKQFIYGTFDFIVTNPPFGSSIKQTEKISNKKTKLKEQVKSDSKYIATVEMWEKEKIAAIKTLEDEAKKKNPKSNKKEITEIIQADKSAVQSTFTDKVNLFKEELTEKYFLAKQTALDDYPIFMAIAEDIGYDATGRNTTNNELTEIGIELAKFITHINKTEK